MKHASTSDKIVIFIIAFLPMHNRFRLGIFAFEMYLHPSPLIALLSSNKTLTQKKFLQIEEITLRDRYHSLVSELIGACVLKHHYKE